MKKLSLFFVQLFELILILFFGALIFSIFIALFLLILPFGLSRSYVKAWKKGRENAMKYDALIKDVNDVLHDNNIEGIIAPTNNDLNDGNDKCKDPQ